MLPRLTFGLLALFSILCGSCERQTDPITTSAPLVEPEEPRAPELEPERRRRELERDSLILGVAPHFASTPIIVALAQGFFADEGLAVSLKLFSSPDDLISELKDGTLDGGVVEMAWVFVESPRAIQMPFGLGTNDEVIGLTRDVWARIQGRLLRDVQGDPVRPIGATVLELLAQERLKEGRPLTFAVESRYASAHYLLRYWLAAAGLQPVDDTRDPASLPDNAVRVLAMAPDQIRQGLSKGALDGFAMIDPVSRGLLGVEEAIPVALGNDVFHGFQGQGFGMTSEWMREHPETRQALLSALIRACHWLLASEDHRIEAIKQSAATLALHSDRDQSPPTPVWRDAQPSDFHPSLLSGTWVYTQMARWGQTASGIPDAEEWVLIGEILDSRWLLESARYLTDAGLLDSEAWLKPTSISHTRGFIDGNLFDPREPESYLRQWIEAKR